MPQVRSSVKPQWNGYGIFIAGAFEPRYNTQGYGLFARRLPKSLQLHVI